MTLTEIEQLTHILVEVCVVVVLSDITLDNLLVLSLLRLLMLSLLVAVVGCSNILDVVIDVLVRPVLLVTMSVLTGHLVVDAILRRLVLVRGLAPVEGHDWHLLRRRGSACGEVRLAERR